MPPSLRPLLTPESVAIVGASATPGKYGHTVLRYLRQGGFKGRIFPINPEGGEHDGLTFYRNLREVPERIDCAFTVIPASATPAVVRDGAAAGVRAMILGASGFAEMGSDQGRARQAEITETARAAGMILLGPNTNGIWNAHHGLALGYNTSHGEPMTPGPVSIAAHSGALFDSFIPRLAAFGCGFGKLVPLGNEATLDMLDVLAALIEDPGTEVIGLIMEAIRDGARFRELAARSRAAGKPLVVLKLGKSAAGASAALAHSSRLAGSGRAYEAMLRDARVPVVGSIETLAAVCTLLSDRRVLSLEGDVRLIGASSSGGGCSLMADHAADRGIALAGDGNGQWTGETAALIASYKGVGLIRNPIDSGNLHGWDKLPELIAAMERDSLLGPVVAFAHRLPTLNTDLSLFNALQARKARTGAPVVVVAPGGLRPEVTQRYAAEQIPVFSDLATCFDSLRAVYDAMAFASEGMAGGSGPRVLASTDRKAIDAALDAARATDFLSEIDSAALLRLAGVPMVETRIAATLQDAQAAARATGFPVVLKAIAPGIAHKNDAGLVAVGLADDAAVGEAFARLAAAAAGLGMPREGVQIIVQKLIPSRAELILGTTFEPGLGHFLVAGLGGVNAELIDSVELLMMPISREAIQARLSASRLGPFIAQIERQSKRELMDGVVEALEALQALVLAAPDRIRSIDVNPLLVGEAGCVAVDALVVPRT